MHDIIVGTASIQKNIANFIPVVCGKTTQQSSSCRGLQRDVVYLDWPIAPSYMSPNAGGGGELRGLSQWVKLYTGAQISFGDLTPYLTYELFAKDPVETVAWKNLRERKFRPLKKKTPYLLPSRDWKKWPGANFSACGFCRPALYSSALFKTNGSWQYW